MTCDAQCRIYTPQTVTDKSQCRLLPLSLSLSLSPTQELLGRMPKAIAMGGHYSLELFNRKGELRNIRRLKFWDLTSVLVDKYRMHIDEAAALTDFLVPMLDFDTKKRATAATMLQHPWLEGELT